MLALPFGPPQPQRVLLTGLRVERNDLFDDLGGALPLLAGYNLVMILPGLLLYLSWRVFGERLRPRFERWREKVARGSSEAMGWIMGIAGILILRDAVYRLGGFDFLGLPG